MQLKAVGWSTDAISCRVKSSQASREGKGKNNHHWVLVLVFICLHKYLNCLANLKFYLQIFSAWEFPKNSLLMWKYNPNSFHLFLRGNLLSPILPPSPNHLSHLEWLSLSLLFPCGSASKESACNAGDLGSIPGLGGSPGEGKGYPLQYSGLVKSMDCIVHGVSKSRTRLSNFHFLLF